MMPLRSTPDNPIEHTSSKLGTLRGQLRAIEYVVVEELKNGGISFQELETPDEPSKELQPT